MKFFPGTDRRGDPGDGGLRQRKEVLRLLQLAHDGGFDGDLHAVVCENPALDDVILEEGAENPGTLGGFAGRLEEARSIKRQPIVWAPVLGPPVAGTTLAGSVVGTPSRGSSWLSGKAAFHSSLYLAYRNRACASTVAWRRNDSRRTI